MNRQQRRRINRFVTKQKENLANGKKTNFTKIQAVVIENVMIDVDGILNSKRAKKHQLDNLYIDWIKENNRKVFDAIPYKEKFGLYQLLNKETKEKSEWVFNIQELLIGKEQIKNI